MDCRERIKFWCKTCGRHWIDTLEIQHGAIVTGRCPHCGSSAASPHVIYRPPRLSPKEAFEAIRKVLRDAGVDLSNHPEGYDAKS